MNRFRCRLQLHLNTFAGVRHPCRSGSGRRHTSFTRFFKARHGTLRLRITKVGLFPELTNLFHSRFARRKRRKAHAATGAEPANHASANHFVKPSAESNEVRTMPRREMDERNSTENRRREEIFRKKCFPSSRHNQKGCFCTRLSLSLTPSWILLLGNVQINLTLPTLIRIFVFRIAQPPPNEARFR